MNEKNNIELVQIRIELKQMIDILDDKKFINHLTNIIKYFLDRRI
ncbi:Uncharacterised protein [[Clostridium] sordellii]|uniref:Uncharacterized protein n=1 Tax=Paraclostridium sordellii TaxID=1505 RepID=A0ABP1XZY7_PARSO|nr:hypothetical protein [Paeniclostridium sordellii]EPZ61812.1 hypothetical protein H477_5975 [[Clostridium] sordellii ATCC 9714] [Paeniclostridium sordellii ATCC 9714]MDK0696008.1 hypothetical protein [Clostridium perfringens]MDU1456207.1 hypothetical protein [Paeniclostridium sordellii]CEJ75457.1 hypothetical protein ATCC9714_PCS200501 (plasmid) [[Clostridium] sordellii] [Paeniclostridium sordellii]CEN67999.1 Uncharacterised protein [[Clostridium] sordellii] [Paeniclostridium sordellii]